jgi:hypothetical protein
MSAPTDDMQKVFEHDHICEPIYLMIARQLCTKSSLEPIRQLKNRVILDTKRWIRMSGAMRKEKSGVDDGWRIPDALWVRIEPLLPAKPPHPKGAAPGQQTARPWTVSSTSYGLAANGKPCPGNAVHPARSMTAISVGDKLGFSRACGRLDCWSMTP